MERENRLLSDNVQVLNLIKIRKGARDVMKKLISIGVLVLLLLSHNVFYNNETAYAIGDGCSESHEFNEETSVRFDPSTTKGIKYHHYAVEYKDEQGRKRVGSGVHGIDYVSYEILVETEFYFKFYDVNNQVIDELKMFVEPFKTHIQMYQAGDNKLSGNTMPNAQIQVRLYNLSDDESKAIRLSSNNEGNFEFNYDERDTVLTLEKKDQYMTLSQGILIKKEHFNSDSPSITKVSGYDSGTGISVESKDLLKGLNLEFYDKNKKLIETNTIKTAETNYSIYGSKKDGSRTFHADGIKYVRVQAFNTINCKSTWTEMVELTDSTPPEHELNPWMEGDVYVTGVSDPGTRIDWTQNPFSKNEVKGTIVVPKNGDLKMKFPLDVNTSPPMMEFYDESGNGSAEWVRPVTRIDKFVVTEDRRYDIFALSDISSGSSYYGKKYSIEFDGRRWPGGIGEGRIGLDAVDDSFNFSKLPYEIKFTLYNVDGSIKYSLRQMITEKEKSARLQNIRYDLDKQEIYADSNLFYMATIWNQKTDWRYSSYAKTKHVKLPLSDNKKIVKVGDKVTLYSTVPYTSGIGQEIVIKQNKKLKTPTVKEVTTKSRYAEGTTYPNSKVLVKSGKKNYQGQSDSKGRYKIKIPSLSAGSEVSVSAVDRLNQSTPVVKVKVLRVFTKFTISKIKSGGTALKGTGYIGSEVKAYKSSKLIAKGTVDKKGNYTIKVSKLKKNDTLLLKMSKSGFQTMTKTIRVN